MSLFDKAKQKFQGAKKRSFAARLIQFAAMGAGNWGKQTRIKRRQEKARARNDWGLWLRLRMRDGRSMKKPGKRDSSGDGALRYDQIQRRRKLQRTHVSYRKESRSAG